jgi:hypothetical protein
MQANALYNQQPAFVEQSCVINHNGRKFESGGAVVTTERIVAYLGKSGVLTDWHGNSLGSYRVVSTWKTPRSFMSSTMSAVHAYVGERVYKGRSAGEGMVFFGKLAKKY